MPIRTPGMRKGSTKRTLNREEGRRWTVFVRVVIRKLIPMTNVAERAASKTEFHRSDWPAANAPGSSVQVRSVEASWKAGRPRESALRVTAQAAEAKNQP